MRIVQMIDTLSWGGAQKMQLFLAESLAPLGIELTVVSLRENKESHVADQLRAAGVRVVYFPFAQFFSPAAFINLVRFLRSEKFDLLHAYLTYSNIVGPLAGKLSGTPTIASLRNADFEFHSYSRAQVFLENLSFRYLATRVMANGEVVAKFARMRIKDSRPVDILVNAVDFPEALPPAERDQLRADMCGDASRPVVLSVGRLTEAKGFHDLIDAFALVHARPEHEKVALVIAGGGSLLEELQTHIRQLELEGNVFLLGQRSDVPRLLQAADFYVSSSHWEGTPVSVLEAMACGLPIVATAVGESPYLLDQGRVGLVVPTHKPADLEAALISLLDSPEKSARFGRAARERVRQHYSRPIWTHKLLELYNQVNPKAGEYLAKVDMIIQPAPENTGVLQASEA